MKKIKNITYVLITLALLVITNIGCQSERGADPNSRGENYTFDNTPLITLRYGEDVHESSNEYGLWGDVAYWDGLYPYQVIELAYGKRIDIEFEDMPEDITILRRWPMSPEIELISTGEYSITVAEIEEKEIIYEIKTDWPQGYAFYVFRVIVAD